MTRTKVRASYQAIHNLLNQLLDILDISEDLDTQSLLGEFPEVTRLQEHFGYFAIPLTGIASSLSAAEDPNRYRDLLESITDGLLAIDRDWRITYLNQKATQNGAYPQAELIGKNLWETFPNLVGTPLERLYQRVMGERTSGHLEVQGSQSSRWYRINVYPSTEGITVLWLDITDRKTAESALQAAHQYTSDILESIQDVFYTVDKGWRLTFVNQAACRAWGKQREELVGKNILEVFPQVINTYPFNKLQIAMEQRQPILYEAVSPIMETWIEVSAYPVAGDGLAVYFRDIQQRKEMEEALKISQERFNQAFLASPLGLVISHQETGLIEEVNESFTCISEYQRDELIGKTSLELGLFVHPKERQTVIEALRKGEKELQVEMQIRTKTRKHLQVLLSVVPLPTDHGEYMLTLVQDVTNQKHLEKLAQEQVAHVEVQRRLLEQREQERIHIARDLHDGPVQGLTAITFALEAMAMDTTRPASTEELRDIRQALQTQIADLRSYAGELRPPSLTKFGLETAIRSHIGDFTQKHPEIKVELQSDQETGEIPENIRLALFRILQEALNNVNKHSHATEVTVYLRQRTDRVRLEISDNGQGFKPPDDWLSLVRAGHLGLVGMRERAEAVGGQLRLKAVPRMGTALWVDVPIQTA